MAIKSYIKEGKKYFKVEVKSRDQFGRQVYRSKQGILSERKAEEEEFRLRKEIDSLTTGGLIALGRVDKNLFKQDEDKFRSVDCIWI